MKKVILLIFICTWVLLAFFTFIKIYRADEDLYKSQEYLGEGDIEMAKSLIDQAIKNNPQEANYYRVRAKVLVVGLVPDDSQDQQIDKESALRDLRTAYNLNPNNLVTIRNEIPLYYYLAGYPSIDENYLPTVTNFLEINKMRFNNDAGVVALVAKYEKKLNLTKEYGDSVKIINILRPDLLQWYESFR